MNITKKPAQPINQNSLSSKRFIPNIFNDIFNDFSIPALYLNPIFNESLDSQIRINLTEKPKEFIVKAEIPGAKKEDIHVNIEGAYVNISAQTESKNEERSSDERVIRTECYFGASSRGFQLPNEIDREKVKASYENGILELILPKLNNGNTKEIEIK